MRDVGKWRRSLPKCSKLENGRVRVVRFIGQRMGWRITLLKVVSRFYRLHSFTLLAANTTTGLINYVYPPGSLHNSITGDFLNEREVGGRFGIFDKNQVSLVVRGSEPDMYESGITLIWHFERNESNDIRE